MSYYVYILSSGRTGTLYVGMTNDVVRRVGEHRQNVVRGFTKKYGVHRLVYFEVFDDIRNAQQREVNLKHWRRDWKISLIETNNPEWVDLYDGIAV